MNYPSIVTKKSERIAKSLNFFNAIYGKIPKLHFSYLIKFKDHTKIYPFDISNETQQEAMAIKAIELSDRVFDVWHAINPVYV